MMTSNLTVDVTASKQRVIRAADVGESRRVSLRSRDWLRQPEFIVLQQKVSIFIDNNGSPEWICNCALDIRSFLVINPQHWLKKHWNVAKPSNFREINPKNLKRKVLNPWIYNFDHWLNWIEPKIAKKCQFFEDRAVTMVWSSCYVIASMTFFVATHLTTLLLRGSGVR